MKAQIKDQLLEKCKELGIKPKDDWKEEDFAKAIAKAAKEKGLLDDEKQNPPTPPAEEKPEAPKKPSKKSEFTVVMNQNIRHDTERYNKGIEYDLAPEVFELFVKEGWATPTK